MVSIELSKVLFISAFWASLSKSDESLTPLKIKFVAFALAKSTVNPLNDEAQNALMNKTLDNSIETIFLISSKNVREISSTNVRQILSLAGDVSNFMSNEIISYINSLKT